MKILVVEDDRAVAQALQLLLGSYNYAVDIAADGEEALQMANAFEYHLVLLDVLLPRLSGVEVCRQLRKKGFRQPILLLTGQGATQQKAISLNAGADDYVVKPFDNDELVARIQELLRRGATAGEPVLTWRYLSLDPNTRRVAYRDQLLALTPKEFAILELFLRHQETVFSARAILDQAWSSLESPGEEAVRCHIKDLRQKLAAVGAPKDLIKTVHRVGYRLNPLYASAAPQVNQSSSAAQVAELRSVNEELRVAMEQLRSTQNELQQKNQELQAARDELEQRVSERTSDREQAETALRESEALYRTLFDSIDEGICLFERLPLRPDGLRDYRYIAMNPTMQAMFGIPDLSGQSIRDSFPNEVEDWYDDYDRVLETGEAIRFERESEPQGMVLEMFVTRVEDESGRRLLAVMKDVTARKRSEASLQFLAELTEMLAHPATPEEMMQRVGAKVGAHLRITNCLFGEIDETQNQAIIVYNWHTPETPDVTGIYQLSDFISPAFLQAAQTGNTIVVEDTQTDSRTDGDRYAALQTAAFVSVPFLQNNTWKYVFAVHDTVPRHWRTDEIELINEVTNRIFPRLERARTEEALRKNEELLRFALAGAKAGSWEWDLITGQFHWSQENFHLHGVNPADGEPSYDEWVTNLIHPDDRERVQAYAEQVLEQRLSTINLEFRVLHPQTGVRWLLGFGNVIYSEQGQPIRLNGINLDISDRKQAEAALQSSEEQRRLALDLTGTATWGWDLATGRVQWSEQMFALFGLAAESVEPSYDLGRRCVHPDDVERLEAQVQTHLQHHTLYQAEYRAVHPDGSVHWVLSKGHGVYDATGQAVRMIGITMDISDRKQAEAKLRESEQKYRSLFESIDQGFCLLEVLFDANDKAIDYRFMEINEAFEQQSGLANAVGKTILELVPNLEPQWAELYGQVAKSGESVRFEADVPSMSRIFDIYAFPCGTPGQNVVAVLFTDITERKRTEEILRRTAELNAFRVSLADALRPLTDASEIQAIAARMLGEALRATRVIYTEVVSEGEEVIVHRNYTNGVAELSGRYCLEDYRRNLTVDHPDGHTQVVTDIPSNPNYTDAEKARYRELDIAAHTDVPLIKNNQFVALLAVQQSTPRQWTETEVKLVEETAERTWAAVERAYTEAALHQNEEMLRLALTGAHAGSWDWELATGHLTWSPETYKLFGLDPNTPLPLYDAWYDACLHPDDRLWINNYVNQIITQRQSDLQLEFRILHPQMGIRWILCLGHLTVNKQEEPVRLSGIDLDISDRKQAELALQKQIQQESLLNEIAQEIRRSLNLNEVLSSTVHRVRAFLEVDRVVIFRFRPDWQGKVIMESVGAEWTPILSTTIFDPCFRDYYIEPYRQGRVATLSDIDTADLQPCYVELLQRLQVKANAVVPILQNNYLWGLLIAHHCSAPRLWQPTEVAALKQLATQVGIAIQQSELYQQLQLELDERKQAEQTIREQAALLDITLDAIFVRDLDNRICYWNQGAERLYGWQAAEAIGQKAHELLQDPDSPIETVLQRLLDQGEWHGELHHTTKTGKKVIVDASWTLIRDEAGQPKSILAVDTDITEKKSLEAQFYQAQRLESLGTLASGIAHDLNNALTPILSVAQLLRMQKTKLDAQSQDMLQLLEDSAKRGANMVRQILTFTRGTGGERAPVDVDSSIQEVVKVIQQTFPKFITIHTSVSAQGVRQVSADATQLHQVLINLCVNARDAMPNGGTLTLAVENFEANEIFAQMNLDAHVGQYVLITVADTGTGIAPDVRDRIFDPFFTTKALGQGTGLGLATVLGIVRNYGGFVQVASEVGKGTQFKVYLPAIETEATPNLQGTTLPQGQGELILVVDDEDSILQSTHVILEAHHYQVLTARSGAEAIAIYTQHREIAVVLVDMMMPDMDGIMLIRILQKMNPQIRAIAVSGLLSQYKQNLETLGIKICLNKPYTTEDLLNSIHLQLR